MFVSVRFVKLIVLLVGLCVLQFFLEVCNKGKKKKSYILNISEIFQWFADRVEQVKPGSEMACVCFCLWISYACPSLSFNISIF